MFGREVNRTAVMLSGTEAEKDLCTALSGDECQRGVSGSAPGAFSEARFLAVDPLSHDVYVGDTGDDLVSKFSSEGVLEAGWGKEGRLDGSTTTAKSFGALAGVGVGATGTLYVMNRIPEGDGAEVFEFKQDGTFTGEVALKALRVTAALGFAVDGAGDLFKANGDGSIEKFDAAGDDVGQVTTGTTNNVGPGAGAFTLDPASGDLYAASLGDQLEGFVFNGSGEVLEPGGGTCVVKPNLLGGQGCAASESFAVPFAGSGVALDSITRRQLPGECLGRQGV